MHCRAGSGRPRPTSQEAAGTVRLVSEEHPNARTYRRTVDAFRAGDRGAFEALVAPDVVWHVPGRHPLARDVRGREAVIEWLEQARGQGFWLTEDDVFGNDEHVCALSQMGARRDDLDVRTRVVSVFRYRDGQQLERWFYPDDADAWDRIFGG